MKVIIIGAGIGGLSVYHALQKHLAATASCPLSVNIKLYETYGSPTSTTSNIGGGLGLAPNGLRAIASVSKNAVNCIQEHGFPGAIIAFRNSTGRLLGKYWNGRSERYGFNQLMLRRSIIHEALLQDIPPNAVVWATKVQSIRETSDGVEVTFADGSSEKADLVLGADGVRSVVRECMFENKYPAEYDGLTGVGGFVPLSSLSERFREGLRTEGVTMTFGAHGFFGYSMVGGSAQRDGTPSTDQEIQWWSIYEAKTPPPRDMPPTDVRNQLLERHGSWVSPYDTPERRVHEDIISLGCSEGLLILPRYVAPRIPHWCSPSGTGRVILLGDAAHAMPPDSGQGVSCAAEDAVALGLLLKHHLISKQLGVEAALAATARDYEAVRMKRVWKILDVAKRNGDSKKKQAPWQQWIRDRFFWVLCRLPESINDRLYAYDVEVAVAGYLTKLKS